MTMLLLDTDCPILPYDGLRMALAFIGSGCLASLCKAKGEAIDGDQQTTAIVMVSYLQGMP